MSHQHGTTNGYTNGQTGTQSGQSAAVQQARRAWLPERPKTQLMTDDDAGATLQLGEFADVPTLSISEARILVEAIHAHRTSAGKRIQHTEVFHRMKTYMDSFARFTSEMQISAVDNAAAPFKQLTMFEKSQLMNLLPGEAEEAKGLIPSLQTKIADAELDDLVQDMSNERHKTYG